MISSAVVIPEEYVPTRPPASPTLKRRQSSFSPDSNKRPRLDTRGNSIGDEHRNGGSRSTDTSSSTSRKPSGVGAGATEERKRGQRLFGALLGTLSQTTSKPVHRKRDEIEQRQRERVKKNNEEREEEVKRKREMLDNSRKAEQKIWDKESRKLRHQNLRATSNFLQTKTEPKLYYRPWELKPNEEVRIRLQINEVEEQIRKETSEDDEPVLEEVPADISNPKDTNGAVPTASEERNAQDDKKSSDEDRHPPDQRSNHEDHAITESKDDGRDQSKDDDRGGEELVEGQEDDVMY